MVCPCAVIPLVAATTAGGAIASRKKKQQMWALIGITTLLMLAYFMYYPGQKKGFRLQKQKRRSSCSVCKLSGKRRIST